MPYMEKMRACGNSSCTLRICAGGSAAAVFDSVRTLAAQADLPCVAIGGIDLARAALLRGTGVVGICVVSAICLAPDPRAAAQALHAAFAGA